MHWLIYFSAPVIAVSAIAASWLTHIPLSAVVILFISIPIGIGIAISLKTKPASKPIIKFLIRTGLIYLSLVPAGYAGSYIGKRIAVCQAQTYLEQAINYVEDQHAKTGQYPRHQKDLPDFGVKPYLLSDELATERQFDYCSVNKKTCELAYYWNNGIDDFYRISFEYPSMWQYDSERPFWMCYGDCPGYDPHLRYDEIVENLRAIEEWYNNVQSESQVVRRRALGAIEISHASCLAKQKDYHALDLIVRRLDWKGAEQKMSSDVYVSKGLAKFQQRLESEKCTAGDILGLDFPEKE